MFEMLHIKVFSSFSKKYYLALCLLEPPLRDWLQPPSPFLSAAPVYKCKELAFQRAHILNSL